jgi:hypothetical protein
MKPSKVVSRSLILAACALLPAAASGGALYLPEMMDKTRVV